MAKSIAMTACELTDDLRNIRNYAEQGKSALVAELVFAAEERLAQIVAFVADTKNAMGMAGPVVMLHAVREG